MAGKSSNNGNWAPNSPATRYKASGKNREFYTFENAPGIGNYATGGTIIDGGDGYIYHIFTGTGTFTVNRPSALIDSVDYLIVAGGGAVIPGPAAASGGGGGGGFLFGNYAVLPNTPYPITVGAGGPSVPNVPTTAGTQRNGSPSEAFGGTIIATGGGSGGNSPPGTNGLPGGSGGGGAFPGGTGGTGNTPATIPRQGYSGATPNGGSSGGGGAGGVGVAGGPTTPQVGAGGPGRIAPEFPSTIVRQAIPAPLLPSWEPLVGPGGYAAGGCGTDPTGVVPAPLTRSTPDNSGYGGQGGGANAGGSGIVCIRYKKTAAYSRATGGTIEPNTHPEHPGVWRHIFTSPGTFTVTDPTLQWIDYLAVGGGGGGGGNPSGSGGGGGAGGFVSSIHTSTTTPLAIPEAYPWNPGYSVEVGEQYSVGIGTYPIGIGTGGNASTVGNDTTIGNPGPSQIIAYGGGRGGLGGGSVGGAGASGGGGSKLGPPATPVFGGTATPTPFIQGNTGGSTPATPQPGSNGAGGGGAGGNGSGGATGGSGGVGWYSVLSPSAYGTPGPLTPTAQYRYFAGGGGGGPSGSGGSGGGGGGGIPTGNPGTTNTGGGGGGGTPAGGTGGPGIVIIQYPE